MTSRALGAWKLRRALFAALLSLTPLFSNAGTCNITLVGNVQPAPLPKSACGSRRGFLWAWWGARYRGIVSDAGHRGGGTQGGVVPTIAPNRWTWPSLSSGA